MFRKKTYDRSQIFLEDILHRITGNRSGVSVFIEYVWENSPDQDRDGAKEEDRRLAIEIERCAK